MRYVLAKYRMYNEELAYRIYITDSLFYQGDNKRLTVRFEELKKPKHIDHRSSDEIASDIILKLGLKQDECI